MEYPMICWNYGRPEKDGSYSERTKFGMISVIIHEIGHNFFPMIVNSDERQWGWMDEGIDTFMQYITEQEFGKNILFLWEVLVRIHLEGDLHQVSQDIWVEIKIF